MPSRDRGRSYGAEQDGFEDRQVPSVRAAGLAGRTAVILGREQRLWPQMAAELRGRLGRSGPEAIATSTVRAALTSGDPERVPLAAFLVGRSRPEVDGVVCDWEEELHGVIAERSLVDLGAWSLAFVEAQMSSVLLGLGVEGAQHGLDQAKHGLDQAIRADSSANWLAVYYLAQLGDPSGWPALCRLLEAPDGFTRLMAARHLVGFLPFDGQVIGGSQVDVVGGIKALLDDEDARVAVEVAALLAEADPGEAARFLPDVVQASKHPEVGAAADDVLRQLHG